MALTGQEKLYISHGSGGQATISLTEIAAFVGAQGVPAGSVTNTSVAADADIALTKLADTAEITTAGGAVIPAGTIQETLQAIADLADPA